MLTSQTGLNHDPMAIRPFCGYNIKDYFGHWLSMQKEGMKLPKIFNVNWFQVNAEGEQIVSITVLVSIVISI